uniref:PmbA/TldA family metallopeptidase n=1 Tax=Paenibacillus zanthoxyli TaxID=369399 RepID=UPI0005661851
MLQEQVIYRVLTAALETGADFAEIFAEDKTSGRLEMVGGMLESSLSGRDYGVGIRVLQGNFSVYAYTNDSSEQNLIDTARSAAAAI